MERSVPRPVSNSFRAEALPPRSLRRVFEFIQAAIKDGLHLGEELVLIILIETQCAIEPFDDVVDPGP